MTLKEFITNYIAPNSTIRLWYKNNDSTYSVIIDKVFMEWELLKSGYADLEILYIKDIFDKSYPEAINIVLKSETINLRTSNSFTLVTDVDNRAINITTLTVTNAKPQCYSDNFNTYCLDKDGNYIKQ